jgi:hypothetical protein
MGLKSVRMQVRAWKDDFPLAATVFTPVGDIYDSEKVVVVISNAMGIFQTYYAPFAR